MKIKLPTISLFLFLLSSLHGQVNLDLGLVSYYPFNGNANDSSKNSLHGIVYGAQLSEGKDGIENSSYYFNGGDSTFILVPFSPELNIEDTLSISIWFKYDTSSINTDATLLNRGNWGLRKYAYVFDEYVFYWFGPQIYHGDTSSVRWNSCYFYSDYPLNDNQWHSIAIIRHKQGGRECIDGHCAYSWSSAIEYPILTNDSSLVIGNVLGVNERGWKGYG
jgi:hypothetical protein